MRHQYPLSTQSLVFLLAFFTIFLYGRHNNDTYTLSLSTPPFRTTRLDYLVGTQMYLSSLLARGTFKVLFFLCYPWTTIHSRSSFLRVSSSGTANAAKRTRLRSNSAGTV